VKPGSLVKKNTLVITLKNKNLPRVFLFTYSSTIASHLFLFMIRLESPRRSDEMETVQYAHER
jgi:hypothetical protein